MASVESKVVKEQERVEAINKVMNNNRYKNSYDAIKHKAMEARANGESYGEYVGHETIAESDAAMRERHKEWKRKNLRSKTVTKA